MTAPSALADVIDPRLREPRPGSRKLPDDTNWYGVQGRDLIAAADALRSMDWREIESAPKDGTWFVALQGGETYPCEWRVEEPDEGPQREGWWDHFNQSFEEPTRWLPAPTGPTQEEK